VGTVSPRKNLVTLIQAFSHLFQDSAIDCPLVLAGKKGWLYRDTFEQIEKLGLGSSVHHIEDIDNTRLAHLYTAAGVLVLPSFYEGFGLPPLEAMHCGCPVIVSDSSSLPEVVGNAGVKLEPTDVDAWAEAILAVLSDSDKRAKMVQDGYIQASKFTWEETARKTLSSYRDCL
jgi:glycosyltransferase involved in cell wall biosynthesis